MFKAFAPQILFQFFVTQESLIKQTRRLFTLRSMMILWAFSLCFCNNIVEKSSRYIGRLLSKLPLSGDSATICSLLLIFLSFKRHCWLAALNKSDVIFLLSPLRFTLKNRRTKQIIKINTFSAILGNFWVPQCWMSSYVYGHSVVL